MKIKLIGKYWLSIVLTKGQFSRCLNPHIGVYVPQQGGWMLHLPPDWGIFHWDWNANLVTGYLDRVRLRKEAHLKKNGAIKTINLPFLKQFVVRQKKKAIKHTYFSVFGKTWQFKVPSKRYQRVIDAVVQLEREMEDFATLDQPQKG